LWKPGINFKKTQMNKFRGWYTGEQKGVVILLRKICRETLRNVGYHPFFDLTKRQDRKKSQTKENF
jgi:hypothetical protein